MAFDTFGAAGRAEGTLQNNLLRALDADDLAVLLPLVQDWTGTAGNMIYEPGDIVEHVYFPCGPSLASFMVVLEDGRSVETVLVGREGAVGGIVSEGRLPAFARAVVHAPGPFLRLPTARLEEAKRRSPSLRRLFTRYADCLLAQVFQSVACNAAHERTGSDEIAMSQEELAAMLGVGRSYVSRVLAALREDGAIESRRRRICIADPQRLERLACGCNRAIRRHFERVLAGVYPGE
jgi:DNA-binding transcriptional regulator YhcF (GntR family)